MSPKKRLVPILVAAALGAGLATKASAEGFSGVVAFGDSLSDAGYYRPFLASIGIPAATVATLGRFTTNPGPIWSENVSRFYGVNPGPSNAGGTIYAQGGANVATPSALTPPGAAQRPVSTQITEYLTANGGAANPNALYTVWVGANDIFNNLGLYQAGAITAAQLQTNVLAAATAEVGQIARLRAAGARYVAVFDIPDIGTTPQFAAAGAATAGAVTALAAGYNTTLWTTLQGAGIQVIPVSAAAVLAEIRANYAAYGFTNITSPACGPYPPYSSGPFPSSQFCGPAQLVSPTAPATYIYADGVHPTTAASGIVGDLLLSMIEGPQQLSLLAEVPLRTRDAQLRTLADGLVQASKQQVGKFGAFVALDGGDFNIDPSTGNPSMDSDNRTWTAGFTMRASDYVTVGLGLGQSTANATFGANGGNFRTRENQASLFFGWKYENWYATGNASISNIDYQNINRNVQLGIVTRVASSTTGGANASGGLAVGYDFKFGAWEMGPFAGFEAQNVTVNSFDESGAGTANLRIGQQTRNSLVTTLGLRASGTYGMWMPYARVTFDTESNNDGRVINASPLALTSGNAYQVAAYQQDDTWGTAVVGVRAKVAENVVVGLSYYTVFSQSNVKQQSLFGSVVVGF
jgi:outer membrane lipase/esterase